MPAKSGGKNVICYSWNGSRRSETGAVIDEQVSSALSTVGLHDHLVGAYIVDMVAELADLARRNGDSELSHRLHAAVALRRERPSC